MVGSHRTLPFLAVSGELDVIGNLTTVTVIDKMCRRGVLEVVEDVAVLTLQVAVDIFQE